MSTKNIILIGMPASGKSTAGVLLAKTVGYGFIDTDLLIQNEQKSLLCDIIAAKGAEEFIKIEETVLSDLWAERCVVATGGSAVYGERAMRHLKEIGTVVYLKLGEKTIEKRLKNIVLRGGSRIYTPSAFRCTKNMPTSPSTARGRTPSRRCARLSRQSGSDNPPRGGMLTKTDNHKTE